MMFSDEGTSCLFGNQAHMHMYVRRLPGEEFKPEYLNFTVKHLLKIVVLACMAHSEVGHRRWNCQCDQVSTPAYCRSPWCHQHSYYFSISSVSMMTLSHVILPNWSPN